MLDCAIDPALHTHAERLSPEASACLFEGRLHPKVLAVSPYVVELSPSDPLTRDWREKGWGQAWGMLIASNAPLMTVRRRLRHFTQAKLPDGAGPVLFRFWDPRVLRVYMPLLEPDQVAAWFKDIDAYIVEAEDGRTALRFSAPNGALIVETLKQPWPEAA